MYNTEYTNVQYNNQLFVDKVFDNNLVKEAEVALSGFVRQKLREDGFTRKIMNPIPVTSADLDRQLTEEPAIIVEKEPDSIAASMPFNGRGQLRYFQSARYAVPFYKVESNEFKKSKFELATYRSDIRTILQENSIKDMQREEDLNFYNNIVSIATANSNVFSIGGGLTVPSLMNGLKNMVAKKLPIGCILMTQSMYLDLLKQPSTQVGSDAASSLFTGKSSLENFYGNKIITTNKNDILPDNRVVVFAPTNYLGQMYILQDSTVFLKVEGDMLSFKTYESIGVGIGNVNGAVVLDF